MRRVLRVGRRGIVISTLAILTWLILGTRSLFYVAVFMTAYTVLMVPLVLQTSDHVQVTRRLRQAVIQVKSGNLLTIAADGLPRYSPISIQLQPVLPAYIIQEEGRWNRCVYSLRFHVNRRGVYDLGECILTVTDPLRLFRISRRVPAQESLIVFPTVLPLEKLRISLTSPLDGQRVKFAPNYDVAQLAGVRPYESDPMNRIHWKMSAHRGDLMVKDFSPSASKTLVVLLNLTLRREPSFTMETFEDYMTTVTASILQYAYDQKLPFGLTILGESTLSSDGYSKDGTHLFSCHRLLAQARGRMDRSPSSTVFLDYLHSKRFTIPRRSQLFLIQQELRNEEIGELLRIQAQFSRVSICLFPYGSFLLYGERPVPCFMPDVDQIVQLKKTQSILRDASVDLSVIGLNDTLAALGG